MENMEKQFNKAHAEQENSPEEKSSDMLESLERRIISGNQDYRDSLVSGPSVQESYSTLQTQMEGLTAKKTKLEALKKPNMSLDEKIAYEKEKDTLLHAMQYDKTKNPTDVQKYWEASPGKFEIFTGDLESYLQLFDGKITEEQLKKISTTDVGRGSKLHDLQKQAETLTPADRKKFVTDLAEEVEKNKEFQKILKETAEQKSLPDDDTKEQALEEMNSLYKNYSGLREEMNNTLKSERR